MDVLLHSAIKTLWNLKFQKRQGWILSGRNISQNNCESVADHSWGASFFGLLFLPSSASELSKLFGINKNEEGYDKNRIIDMLIVHDLAESLTGDIASVNKTPRDEVKEQEAIVLIRKNFECSDFPFDFEKIVSLWTEFESQNTLNAKIARDIDQIECYLQLWCYRDELIRINGMIEWKKLRASWRSRISCSTLFGKWMLDWIDENIGCD